jgi:hypothetical protein
LEALLVAVRENLHPLAGTVGKAEPFEPAICGRVRGGPAHLGQPAEVAELIPYPHLGVDAALLRKVAETEPFAMAHRTSAPTNMSGIRPDQPEHSPHRRRLAGTVRPQEAGDPPTLDAECAPVQRGDRPEPLGQTVELEHVTQPCT